MILNELIKETQKNQMISILLKHYKVESVKMKYKSMKDHAYFNVETGVMEISTRYKTLKTSQVKEFLITILHEIDHAVDAKKYGWKKFKEMYEFEMNLQVQAGKNEYDDNEFEIKAEKFGQKNWKKWYTQFKKEGLI